MKNFIFTLIFITGTVSLIFAGNNVDNVMQKQSDGTYVINTTSLCSAKGFKSKTPVEVYIRNGKVIKVAPLQNNESPNFFGKVKKFLLPLYNDLKVDKAKILSKEGVPDGCTGATYSSRAVQENISAALEYYESHK